MASLTLEAVSKTYPNGYVAAHALDLHVEDGELLVLVGPSGSGKSTALRLIAGLESPTRGRVWIGDRDVTLVPPQERDLAMVFQSYALYPHRNVRQNLEFPLRMRRAEPGLVQSRVAEVARALGLEPLLERKPAQLSGGQRQRVALGRAMVREPRAFLFDEPLSNLDPKLRVQTRAELALLHRRLRATMVYVTHDQEEAMTLGDRICVMNDGRIQQLAPPLDVYRRPANVFVAGFIGSPAMNLFPCTARAAQGGLRLEGPGLSLEGVAADGGVVQARDGVADGLTPAGKGVAHAPEGAVVGGVQGGARELLVGIRPHDLVLAGGAADLHGRVSVVEPLGSEQLVHVAVDGAGEAVRVMVPAEQDVQPDAEVGLRLRRDRLHLFDAATGNRIG